MRKALMCFISSKILRVIFLLLTICCGCFFLFQRITIANLENARINAVPFLLELHLHDFHENPNGVLYRTKAIARRSDGSTSVVESYGPWNSGQYTRKVTFIDGLTVTFGDSVQKKSTMNTINTDVKVLRRRLTNSLPTCISRSQESLIGNDVLFGQSVFVIKINLDDSRQIIAWRAPALGCEDLQYIIENMDESGAYHQIADAKPARFVIGDPDSSFFDSGATYTEEKPSDLISALLQQIGLPLDLKTMAQGSRLDAKYLKQKSKVN